MVWLHFIDSNLLYHSKWHRSTQISVHSLFHVWLHEVLHEVYIQMRLLDSSADSKIVKQVCNPTHKIIFSYCYDIHKELPIQLHSYITYTIVINCKGEWGLAYLPLLLYHPYLVYREYTSLHIIVLS